MITAITFKFEYNKKYLNEQLTSLKQTGRPIYSEKTTTDLEGLIKDDIELLTKFKTLLSELNSDLLTCDIENKIVKHLGHEPRITNITKHRRTYFIAGMTIHEQDQTM